MTPFLQFRIWFRRASAGQKAAAATSVVLLLALVTWSLLPTSDGASNVVAAIGQPGGSVAAQQVGGSAQQGGGVLGSGGASGGGTTGANNASGGNALGVGGVNATANSPDAVNGVGVPAPGSPSGLPGSGASQTCTKMGTLKIGVVVPSGAGGTINSVIGAPPQAEEEADYAAVLDAVNKAGGVKCNNLVGDYATADLTNPSSAQAGCLQFQQDKVFAVLGGFEPLFSDDCLLQAHIPTFDELPIPASSAKKYFPYYYTDYPTYDVLYKNFARAVGQMGYFSPAHHFAKIGIFYKDCTPQNQQAMLAALASAGVPASKVDTFDLGCSSAFAPPSAIEQAVLKFKSDGVTTATINDDIADTQNISNSANRQGWKPEWVLPDFGEVSLGDTPNQHPNAAEFDGALAITSGQYGGIASHLPETPGTQQCDQVMKSHNLPSVYASGDQFAGSACSQVWMLVGALQHGSLSAAGIAAGLQAAKSIQLSFPLGPNDFSAPGTTWGGQFWRVDRYHGACQCWMVENPTWNPSFP